MDEQILAALKTVNDPEIGLNIVDLGLIYGVRISSSAVKIEMTMTAPMCPMSGWIAKQARQAVHSVVPDHDVRIELVWSPAWTPECMSAAARKQLNLPASGEESASGE